MARIVPNRYRGMVKPDARLKFSPSESGFFDNASLQLETLTSASPLTGIAVPDQTTDMALRASGSQTEDLEVYVNRRGLPTLDGAGYLYKRPTDAERFRRGCDFPVPAAAWQPIDLNNTRFARHLVATPDDYLIETSQDFAGNTYTRTLDPATQTWGSEVTVDTDPTLFGEPCLLVVPRETGYSLLLYRWEDDGSDHQVRVWHSDDLGATWVDDGLALLEELDGTEYPDRFRLRAAYSNGQILLVGHIRAIDSSSNEYRNRIVQWASSDGGGQFTRVVISDGTDEDNSGAFPDLAVWRGEFVLGRLIWDAASSSVVPVFRRLASATYPWTSGSDDGTPGLIVSAQEWGVRTQPGGAGHDFIISEGELALWVDDETSLYAAGRHCAGGDDGGHPILRSIDGGTSWTVMGQHPAYPANGSMWWNTGVPGPGIVGTDNELMGFVGVSQRGRSVMVTSWRRAGGGGSTNFTAAIWLGGWQTSPMPSLTQALSPQKRTAWDFTGCGMHLPSESIWAYADTGGTEQELLTGGRVAQTTGAGEQITNTYVPTTTIGQGMFGEWSLQVDAGTAFVTFRTSSASPVHHEIQVRITSSTVQLFDNIAAGQIGSIYNHTDVRLRIRLALEDNDAVLYTRGDGSAALFGEQAKLTFPDREWVEVARSSAIGSAAADPGMLVVFGASQSTTCFWDEWYLTAGSTTGVGLFAQPDRLKFPRSLIDVPSWAAFDTKFSAVTGPAASGDTWQIEATADYPPDAMLPTVSPSPRHIHRTGPVSALDGTYRWTFIRTAGIAESAMGVQWGVLVDGLNMGGAEIYTKAGGTFTLAGSVGPWVFVAERFGATLQVKTGGILNSAVIRRDELAGCLVEFVSGSPAVTDFQYRVLENDPGAIDTTDGETMPLRILLDGIDVGSPVEPTVRIWPRRALLLLDLDTLGTEIQGIQLRVPVDNAGGGPFDSPAVPPEGFFEVATMAAGPVWAWGWTPGSGRSLTTEVDVELSEAEDGTTIPFSRKPARRRLEWVWEGGVPQGEYLQSRAPDFIATKAGGPATAFRHSTPGDLSDQLRSLGGALTPVVVCQRIDTGDTGGSAKWARGAFLARIIGTIDQDGVSGDEEWDMQDRVQGVGFEEIT